MTLTYDKNFFSQMDDEAIRSARVVVPLVNGWLRPQSVLDVGGGTGGWTAAFAASGIADYLCVDGAYVDRKALRVPPDHFRECDLSQPLNLNRRFDLVVCLEVGEHLPAAAAEVLISSLTRHSNAVLFSAAIPHQKGTYHVNLQWPAYWAELFASQGYSCFDCLRPVIWNEPEVSCWYKQNALLYLNEAGLAQATDADQLRRTRVKSPLALVHPEVYLFNMQEFDALRCLYQPPPFGWALKALAKSAKSLVRSQSRRILHHGE
jgi:SAM-dependent methyltransferase